VTHNPLFAMRPLGHLGSVRGGEEKKEGFQRKVANDWCIMATTFATLSETAHLFISRDYWAETSHSRVGRGVGQETEKKI